MKIVKISLVTLILFFSFKISAQNINIIDKDSLLKLSENIFYEINDADKKINNKIFTEYIEQILYNKESFYEMFEFLNSISVIMSQDKKIKIISWFMPLAEEHKFFCFIQEMIEGDYNFFYYESKEITNNYNFLTNLQNQTLDSNIFKDDPNLSSTKVLNEKSWMGSIYYDIKKYKKEHQDYYILIGWSGSKSGNWKIIEPIFFDNENQEFKFGKPIFNINDKILYRYILSYYKNSKLTLEFYDSKTIVFENMENFSNKSMPDGSYNALILQNKKWILKDNFTPKNKIKLRKRKKINNNLFPN